MRAKWQPGAHGSRSRLKRTKGVSHSSQVAVGSVGSQPDTCLSSVGSIQRAVVPNQEIKVPWP